MSAKISVKFVSFLMAVNGVIFNSKIKQLVSWEGDIVAASKNLLHLCHHKRNCLLNCHHFLQCHHSYHRHHFYHRHQLIRIRHLLFSEIKFQFKSLFQTSFLCLFETRMALPLSVTLLMRMESE